MYFRIEPSGCCHRKGMLQVRIDCFLESKDARHEEHHVYAPVDETDFVKWEKENPDLYKPADKDFWGGYPGVRYWRDNAFHHGFVYVEPDISDDAILDLAEEKAKMVYVAWKKEEPLDFGVPKVDWPAVVVRAGMSADEIERRSDELKARGYKDLSAVPHAPDITWIVPTERVSLIEAKRQHLQVTSLERRISKAQKARK